MMLALNVSNWFKSASPSQDVKIGSVFRNVRRGNIIEIAKVLDIAPDSMGVPHVHYAVSIRSAHQECFEEHRTLGLASFAQRFADPVTG